MTANEPLGVGTANLDHPLSIVAPLITGDIFIACPRTAFPSFSDETEAAEVSHCKATTLQHLDG